MVKFFVNVPVDGAGLLAKVDSVPRRRPYDGVYADLYDPDDIAYTHVIGKVYAPDGRFAVEDVSPAPWAGDTRNRRITWYLLDNGTDGFELTRLLPIVHHGRLEGLTYESGNLIYRAGGFTMPSLVHGFTEVQEDSWYPDIAGGAVFDSRGQMQHIVRYDKRLFRIGLPSISVRALDTENYHVETFLFALHDGEFVPCNVPVSGATLITLVSLGTCRNWDLEAFVGLDISVQPESHY